MKKLLSLVILALWLFTFTFAANTTVQRYNLPNNLSSKVWTTPKLTGVNYMNALNSRALGKINQKATHATLTTTLDKVWTTKMNYKNHTYTITVGYTSCKVNAKTSRTELPKTITVDLTNVHCLNKKEPVNFLPELKAGKRMNVFFAKINGKTKDTAVRIW